MNALAKWLRANAHMTVTILAVCVTLIAVIAVVLVSRIDLSRSLALNFERSTTWSKVLLLMATPLQIAILAMVVTNSTSFSSLAGRLADLGCWLYILHAVVLFLAIDSEITTIHSLEICAIYLWIPLCLINLSFVMQKKYNTATTHPRHL